MVFEFDESIQFSDDYDLWMRIVHDHAVAYVDEPLARYRLHDANESRKIAGIVSATIQVLRKTLRAFPDARALVGDDQVRRRFAQLECALSRHHFEQSQWAQFVRHLVLAMVHDRRVAQVRALPEPALDRLQWYARRMGLRWP